MSNTKKPGISIIEVTAHYEITINLGNYEKAVVGGYAKATIDPNESTASDAYEQAFAAAKDAVKAQALPLLAKRQNQMESIWNGLPESVKKQFEGQY